MARQDACRFDTPQASSSRKRTRPSLATSSPHYAFVHKRVSGRWWPISSNTKNSVDTTGRRVGGFQDPSGFDAFVRRLDIFQEKRDKALSQEWSRIPWDVLSLRKVSPAFTMARHQVYVSWKKHMIDEIGIDTCTVETRRVFQTRHAPTTSSGP